MQKRQTKKQLKILLGAAWLLGTTTAIVAPIALGTAPAWAQENGGGEGGEGGGGGGNGEGGKGKGQGGGQHGKPVPPEELPPLIPGTGAGTGAAGGQAGAFQSGNYFRIELGAVQGSAGDANWQPPGPADPRVFFDLDINATAMGAIALGHSYGNGWRAEAALNVFGSTDFAGPWSYTVPADPGPHADMEGSVRSVALLANGYYDFTMGGKATPFVTAGLGVARNTMGNWTRINPEAGRPVRSFEGNTDTSLAWTIGAGVAWDVGPVLGSAPAKLELAWRYFDLGSVSGGTTALPGSGAGGTPVEALNFDVTDQVITLGLRIPM